MNIPSYFNFQTSNTLPKQNTVKFASRESFSSMLLEKQQNSSSTNHFTLRMGGLFSYGDGFGRTIYMDYDESSTEDDPVIYAEGIGDDGKPYKTKIHVNDINPYNATYLEMTALALHTGNMDGLSPISPTSGHHSYFEKENYIKSFASVISDFNLLKATAQIQSETERLNTYLDFFNSHKKD